MRLFWRILKYFAALSISLILILYILSILFEKDISRIFISELNKRTNAEIISGEIKFSLLQRFPQGSINIESFLLKSPQAVSPETDNFTDTLLYADRLILTLEITKLLKKDYSIDRIDIQNGNINLLADDKGLVNTNIWKEQESHDSVSIDLNINDINISNSSFSYISPGFRIRAFIESSSNRINIRKSHTITRTRARLILESLATNSDYRINNKLPIQVNTGLSLHNDSIGIKRSDLIIDDMQFKIDGSIGLASRNTDLNIVSGELIINRLKDILPHSIAGFIDRNIENATVNAALNLKGQFQKSSDLKLGGMLNIREARLNIKGSENLELDNISMNAALNVNFKNSKGSFSFISEKFNAEMHDSDLSGALEIRGLEPVNIDLIIKGMVSSSVLTDLTDNNDLKSTSGNIRLNARLSGIFDQDEDNYKKFLNMDRSINLGLSSVNLSLPGLEGELENINGNLMISENVWIDDISLNHKGQFFALNGMISGFNSWVKGNNDKLEITAGIWSDKLNLDLLQNSFSGNNDSKDKRNTNLELNLNLNCDSITAGRFRASLFDGNIGYLPGLMDISSFSMNALGGFLSGNITLADIGEKFAARGWFGIDGINITETFNVFNNFRQDYITADNIEGELSGEISLSATTDRNFKTDLSELVLNGEYSIQNGKLIDFEPAYKLSRFIDIEELENISFSKLENDLIINNELIIIPAMDISSSAFNISVEGTHSFEGDYEYRLKVLLSELLSNRENETVSEFGIIEDDGLGHTSLHLKLNGSREGSRITHDTRALRAGIRQDLNEEKANIKTMLNEEYGWYEKDSLPDVSTEGSRRFRIIWEETDSIITDPGKKTEKKIPLFNLFKRKNKKKEPEKK